MQTTYTQENLHSLLSKVKIFNKEIGSYELFAITNTFDYTIKLSNGTIYFKIEELQANENDMLTPEILTNISKRFTPLSQQSTEKEKPPIESTRQEAKSSIPEKKNNFGWRVFKIVIVLILIFVGLQLYADYSRQNYNYGSSSSYQDQVMSVEEIEYETPTDFLSSGGTYRRNILGTKLIIKCEIINKATVATYKDAVIKVKYYSKTNSEIGSDEHTIYEVFSPQTKRTVELKVENYSNVKTIGWEVVSAERYDY